MSQKQSRRKRQQQQQKNSVYKSLGITYILCIHVKQECFDVTQKWKVYQMRRNHWRKFLVCELLLRKSPCFSSTTITTWTGTEQTTFMWVAKIVNKNDKHFVINCDLIVLQMIELKRVKRVCCEVFGMVFFCFSLFLTFHLMCYALFIIQQHMEWENRAMWEADDNVAM